MPETKLIRQSGCYSAYNFVHHNERAADCSYSSDYSYSRSNNPNRNSLESVLAKLEKGVAAAFSAGDAAGMIVFQSLSLAFI